MSTAFWKNSEVNHDAPGSTYGPVRRAHGRMTRQRPSKKSVAPRAVERRVFPMELQIGDRLVAETGGGSHRPIAYVTGRLTKAQPDDWSSFVMSR